MQQEHVKLLTVLNISEQYIISTFGIKTVQRGIDYYRQGRVRLSKVIPHDTGSMEVNSEVIGSQKQLYEATVNIIAAKASRVRVESDCDCPVNFQCKHGLATLLQFADFVLDSEQNNDNIGEKPLPDRNLNVQTPVDDWLHHIKKPATIINLQTTKPSDNKQYQLFYKLNIDQNNSQILLLETVKAKPLLRGGYSKDVKQDLSYIASNNQYENIYFEQIDQEIAHLLVKKSTTTFYNYNNTIDNSYELEGDLGLFILDKILKTKRCFWQNLDEAAPLSKGNSRELLLSWDKDDENYYINRKIKPEIDCLFHLEQLFYVDNANRKLGLIKHDNLTSQQIKQLLAAPLIPSSEAEKVSLQLLQQWPNADIPLPVNLGIEDKLLDSVIPQANCLLYSYEITDYNSKTNKRRIHLLRLRFNYDEFLISPEVSSDYFVEIQNKVRLKIKRQLQQEANFLEQLEQYQFISLPEIGQYGCEYELYLQNESEMALVWMWHDFQEEIIPLLKEQGWQFEFDESFSLHFDDAEDWYAELNTLDGSDEKESHQWFAMDLGIEINGEKFNLLPVLVDLIANEASPHSLYEKLQQKQTIILPITSDRWIKLPTKRLLSIFGTLIELYDKDPLNSDGSLVFNKQQSIYFTELLNDPKLYWKGEEELRQLNDKLKNFSGIEEVVIPDEVNAQLRDYQLTGINWLHFLRDFGFNGILADDMGLGKTIQTLVHLLYEKQHYHPTQPNLIIAPTSLMGNWIRETKRFTDDLQILLLHGPERQQLFKEIHKFDIVLTTYPLMLRDNDFHKKQQYHYIILDESQNIKNARSKTTQQIFSLSSNYRLCLTGTPMENHLGEIWSMFHFLMPGYLGNLEKFNRLFRKPIENMGDYSRQQTLSKRLKPFMLRRTKSEVANELPPKTEIIRSIPLSGKQRDLYETIRLAMDKRVQLEINKKGLARSQIMILDALLKLRQTCCDPALLPETLIHDTNINSAKMELLMDLVPEMLSEGRKIIIFSQFVKMLAIIEKALVEADITFTKLTGQTKKRDEAINSFQNGDVDVFLISLKAGGVGLNLTAADTVIHYDPWWNPAVENQATDRAHRLGQDKPVFVYKLLTTDTVEEKIHELQKKKQQLANRLYKDNSIDEEHSMDEENSQDLSTKLSPKKAPIFSREDLMQLLDPLS